MAGFFGLLELECEFQGLGLWYMVKESRYLLLLARLKDKRDRTAEHGDTDTC